MPSEMLWLALPLGLGYVLLFWSVSLRAPCVPLVLVFGLAPFQNDVSGMGWLHFSLSEVHLLLSVPLLLYRGWRGSLGWMTGALWGGLMVTVFLTVPNWRETSVVSLIQMGLYWAGSVAVFTQLPAQKKDLVVAWHSLMVVGGVLALAALVNRSSYFWGLNKNGVGASLSCALIVTAECWSSAQRRQRTIYLGVLLLIAAGLILVLSRGAWLAAAVGTGFLLAWRGQYRRLAQLGMLLVPVVAMVWAVLPEESKSYATGFDDSRYNIRARTLNTEWAVDQWRSSPLIGVGAGLRKEYDATNVLWLTLAETGPVGLLAFLTAHGRLIFGVWMRRKSALVGDSGPSATALAGALVLAKLVHGLVDHYWSRGAIMVAWAAVGMALSGRIQSGSSPNSKPQPVRARRGGR